MCDSQSENTLLRVLVGGVTKSSFDFRRLSFNIIRAAANAIFARLFSCVFGNFFMRLSLYLSPYTSFTMSKCYVFIRKLLGQDFISMSVPLFAAYSICCNEKRSLVQVYAFVTLLNLTFKIKHSMKNIFPIFENRLNSMSKYVYCVWRAINFPIYFPNSVLPEYTIKFYVKIR